MNGPGWEATLLVVQSHLCLNISTIKPFNKRSASTFQQKTLPFHMLSPPILLRIAGLPAKTLTALNYLSGDNLMILEKEWNLLYFQTVTVLCKIANDPNLLNGLQMTSHSLAGRIEKILDELPPTLRKKEQQTARSLWQIVSRMAGKTSPFSSFTHLGRVDEKEKNPGAITHRFRLNNLLLGQLLEILRYHPPFFQQQKLSLNYTTEFVGTEYIFLHNTRNLESVQRVEAQPVIRLIVDLLKNAPTILFQELVEKILVEVAAEETEIVDYLFTLAEYGLLVWELPVSPTADNWWVPLAENLRQLSDDPLCQKLEKILTDTGTILNNLADQTPLERAAVQRTYFAIFKNIWEENNHHIPVLDSELVLEEGLKQITDKEFLLKPENLFYEDTRILVKKYWTENNWRPLREKMQTLSRLLAPLTPSAAPTRLFNFYQKNFNQPVSLWAFYQKWLPVARMTQKAENSQNSVIELNLNNRLATLPRSESLVHLNPDFLRSLTPDVVSTKRYGSLVLPFQSAGQNQVFLDTFVPANARLAGRFLPLFPMADTETWRNFHQKIAVDNQWVENKDASFFNANVHPPLLSASLQIPSLSVAGLDPGIPITEIMIQADSENNQLILTYKKQTLEVLNLSLEATDNRSGLYRLLCQLEPIVPSKNLLLRTINQLSPPTGEGVIKYPRIVYDQQITLQRATWFFPKNILPLKSKGSSHAAYLEQLSTWQTSSRLPDHFYYTLNLDHRATGASAGRNQHKPQFFDFRNPLSIDLFHRDLKKVTHYLKVEEVLPLPEQMIQVDGVKRMVEGLVVI